MNLLQQKWGLALITLALCLPLIAQSQTIPLQIELPALSKTEPIIALNEIIKNKAKKGQSFEELEKAKEDLINSLSQENNVGDLLQCEQFLKDLGASMDIIDNQNGTVSYLVKTTEKTVSFDMDDINYTNFQKKLKNALEDVTGDSIPCLAIPTVSNTITNTFFVQALSSLDLAKEGPTVANVRLRKDSFELLMRENQVFGVLINPQLSISFCDGYMENVQLKGELKHSGEKVVLGNSLPVGISSRQNLVSLSKQKLISTTSYAHLEGDVENHKCKEQCKHRLFIPLEDVLSYEPIIDLNLNDLSPGNQVISLDKEVSEKKVRKEGDVYLLEGAVYSDLLGTFNAENPNGVLQIELEKRFNILNIVKVIGIDGSWTNFGFGGLEHLDLQAHLLKAEVDNKLLKPSLLDELDRHGDNKEAITYLDIHQQKNYSIGASLNLFFLKFPHQKIDFSLDATGKFFGVAIGKNLSSLQQVYQNGSEFGGELSIKFVPEKRINLKYSLGLNKVCVPSLNDSIVSIVNGQIAEGKPWIVSQEAKLSLNFENQGKLFLRYGLHYSMGNSERNYSQLQFGYSFYILEKNKKNPIWN